MDASQYTDYVLTLLLMNYVSAKYAGMPYDLPSEGLTLEPLQGLTFTRGSSSATHRPG